MSLAGAIARYHDLLAGDLGEVSAEQMDDQLRSRGLFFGDRPLCSVLRPRFLTLQQYSFLRARVAVLLGALAKVHARAVEVPRFRQQLRMQDWEEALLAEDPGFDEPSPVSRLDAFFTPERGGLRFTEYNAETPAAAAYTDVLAQVFYGLPVMREFLREYEVRSFPARHHVMHALLSAWSQWSGGARRRPRIAILDWREVPTYSEFVISAEYLRSQGLECSIADPRDVEYTDGRLRAGDFEIDMIYKRVLINELIERGGLDHPVVRAVRDHAVCMVNPFHCKPLHKKAAFAVMSDEQNAELFTETEREVIGACIPWTRVVEDRVTEFDGDGIELLPFLEGNRERFVLKPNDDYGGKGIVLGWETTPEGWTSALEQALHGATVAQERIAIPKESYPSFVDGQLQIEERILDTAPFVFHGAYMEGVLTRLSTESLVNVTAGGGSSLATFVVDAR